MVGTGSDGQNIAYHFYNRLASLTIAADTYLADACTCMLSTCFSIRITYLHIFYSSATAAAPDAASSSLNT